MNELSRGEEPWVEGPKAARVTVTVATQKEQA